MSCEGEKVWLEPHLAEIHFKSTLQRKWRPKYRVIFFFLLMASYSPNYYNSHDFDVVIALSAAAAVRSKEPPIWRKLVFKLRVLLNLLTCMTL